jgi:hypothetical protein
MEPLGSDADAGGVPAAAPGYLLTSAHQHAIIPELKYEMLDYGAAMESNTSSEACPGASVAGCAAGYFGVALNHPARPARST